LNSVFFSKELKTKTTPSISENLVGITVEMVRREEYMSSLMFNFGYKKEQYTKIFNLL